MSDKTKHQRRRYAAEHKFAKVGAFNGLIDQGGEYAKDGRKAKLKMADSWSRRGGRNVKGYYKPQLAKAEWYAVLAT